MGPIMSPSLSLTVCDRRQVHLGKEGVCAPTHLRELVVRRARLAGLRTVELGRSYWWALGSLCLHAK
jgi:hypothetical protein